MKILTKLRILRKNKISINLIIKMEKELVELNKTFDRTGSIQTEISNDDPEKQQLGLLGGAFNVSNTIVGIAIIGLPHVI